ncbi:MAG: phasin family protein [Deltaproteobacteria bacterium]|nr:phasin family protein [Deltaproteobacteria bacterium]
MLDLIKKSLEAAIGGISSTQEKMKELADELVVKGHLTKKEGVDLLEELKETVKESHKKLSAIIEDQVRKIMKEMGVATRADVKALTGRIDKLEKELAKSKKKSAPEKPAKAKTKKN